MTTILVFGDSITYGAWDIEGGWVQRLRRFLDKKVIDSNADIYYLTYNLGISGDTSELLIERLKQEIDARIEDKDEDVVILISIGGNDSILDNENKTTRVAQDKFESNLKKSFTLAKNYSKKIVFVNSIPVDETKVDPIPWVPGCSYKNELRKKFNNIAKSISKKENIHFIDVNDAFEKMDYRKLLVDGVHPDAKGHEKIFEIVRDYLIKNKII